MATTKFEVFDIRNFLDRLEPAKEKGKYVCPVCAGNNLSIKASTGAYKCWNGCEEKDVREAIRPWAEAEAVGSPDAVRRAPMGQRSQPATRYCEPKPAPFPQGEIALTRCSPTPLPTPQTPQWKPNGVPANAEEIIYPFSPTQFVHRFQWVDKSKPKGREKAFRQRHIDSDGRPKWGKGPEPWPAYWQEKTISAIAEVPADVAPVLLIQEGEGCVHIALSIGLVSVTFQGSAWNRTDIERFLKAVLAANPRTIVVFLVDADTTGEKKAQVVSESCNACGVPFMALSANIFLSNNMTPEEYLIHCENNPSGDIKEILDTMTPDEFISRLEEEIHRRVEENSSEPEEAEQAPDSFSPAAEFTQKALEILYGDEPWICVSDRLYKWQGTYYKESLDALELRRLSNFCNGYAVTTERGTRYPYAKPGKVKEALEWVKMRLAIDPKDVNPGGPNFTNGVLEFSWDGSDVSWKLQPHDPSRHLYLYEPLATFNPDADPQHCDRLLEVLDEPQREIFLRTIGASFDIPLVRSHRGREVRALLLKGDGSNGKDSLREMASLMYGRKGITSCTFDDFAQADNGRKFPTAVLEHSRVNWPSENSGTKRLDKLQSAKVAITGDPFTIERKGKDPYDVELKCVHLFNINDSPNLSAALEAIGTRYGVLTFSKTFKPNPDLSRGELKADPRFKYDPQFVRENVLPAFVNRVLEAFSDLMREGIDYTVTNPALSAIQCESNHLWEFAKNTGLHVVNGGKLYAGDIWQKLKDWYLANGTLEIETTDKGKEKSTWYDMANPSDRLCKAVNQIPARIGAIFPKAKKGRDEGGTFLANLAWGQGDGPGKDKLCSPKNPDANCVRTDAMADAVSHTQQATDATDAIFQSRCEKNSEKIDSTSDATFNFSHKEESEIASVASVSLPARDTASAAASEIASATVETASGDRDWTIEGAIATASANEGDALEGLAPLELPDEPTEADLAVLTGDMLAAVTDNDLALFNTLRELYSGHERWLRLAAHEIRKAKPESYAQILAWLTEVPEVVPVPEVQPILTAEVAPDVVSDFPGVGDLVWRSPIASEWNAKTKQRKPAQPGCLCRIVQVSNNSAIALCESDGSKYHVSRCAWQSGLFAPYRRQDGK